MRTLSGILIGALAVLLGGCGNSLPTAERPSQAESAGEAQAGRLPPPYATPSTAKFSKVIGWPKDRKPEVVSGFRVSLYASDLDGPRWMYVLPNGDVLVAEGRTVPRPDDDPEKVKGMTLAGAFGNSANRVTLLRDANGDGRPEVRRVFLSGIKQPFGMLLLRDYIYVAATDGVWRYRYQQGKFAPEKPGQKIVTLPAGGYNNHWTRNLLASPDGSKIYISVGSASNVGENGMELEHRRANILEINPDGTGEVVFASGIRNPTAMDWAPGTTTLWAVANERDELGDELVPDYLTSVQRGGFYGWPYSYYGQNEDPRRKGERPDLVAKALVPDVPLGSHTASLGFIFYPGNSFPEHYRNGAFVSQHGSWNHSRLVGYKVVFIPFDSGKPTGKPQDFLTGFVHNLATGEVYGRPMGLATLADGSLLVSDDAAGVIWRVSATDNPA